jgi:hypothetical protein
MDYTIEIKYTTGDSFNSFEEKDKIGVKFKNYSDAEKTLEYIMDQQKIIDKIENDPSISRNSQESIINNLTTLRGKEWYCSNEDIEFKEEIDGSMDNKMELFDYHWKNYILVPGEDNKKRIQVFWNGYFETLNSAKIINDSPNN